MTAIRGYVAPTKDSDALGVHSLDQFVLAVPDANVAQEFYGNFGLDVARDGNALTIRTFGHEHRWGSIVEGKSKALYGKLTIEADVYIGANCSIMPNIVIGEAAVVGAGSFVNKNCEPYGVYVGSPAKKIATRPKLDPI